LTVCSSSTTYVTSAGRSFNCVTLKALISPGSTVNPREIVVFLEAPSPNQRRSFKKNPFGIPTREIREVGPGSFPETTLTSASQAPIKESIIGLE
jgi:hypothetical protein